MKQSINETRWTLTLLNLMFIHLKLSGDIDWAWVWVFAPFWIPLSVVGAALILYGIFWLFSTALRNARQ